MATRFVFLLSAILLASLPACSAPEESGGSMISSATAAEPAQPLWPAPAADAVADGNVKDYY